LRVLYVGDPHATPDSIDEMERLVDYILQTAKKEKPDVICFLGDQYHTHSIIHLSVLAFWQRAFWRLKLDGCETIMALVGNHDKAGVKGQTENAMMVHQNIMVVDKPRELAGILFVPYVHDPAEFVQICQAHSSVKTVVCHQTFAGSYFENGFLTPDGVEPNLVPQEQVISGHVHSPQRVGKVWYPGAPRWRTVSDANTERAIWLVEHAEDGSVVGAKAFPTAGVCRPIYALTDVEDSPASIPEGASVVVDVHGTAEYVERRKRELEAGHPGVRIRTFPAAEKVARVRESDGLPVALKKFLGEFTAKNGTPPDELWKLAAERISWLKAQV
jgi:DNA repair exonuclease SbcCD nuclease subunit